MTLSIHLEKTVKGVVHNVEMIMVCNDLIDDTMLKPYAMDVLDRVIEEMKKRIANHLNIKSKNDDNENSF